MKAIIAAACAIAVLPVAAAYAEHPEIGRLRAAERKVFTDSEIADGFFQTAFGAEFRFGGQSDRIRKYDGPVRVFIDTRAKPDRRAAVMDVIADIGARIRHLDIAATANRNEANVTIILVRDRDLQRTIRDAFGRERAQQIERSLHPQCLSRLSKDESFRIVRSDVIVVADAGDFIFFDCIYEELLQGLGPINDTDKVPWTMFNDHVHKGFFDVYDQYLLNILYDPRIRPGMTADEVKTLLPQVLADVRAWVAKTNGLGP